MTNKKRGTISIVIICILIVFCIVPATGSGAAAGATASVPDNPGAGQGLVGWQSQDIDGTAKYGRYFELAVDTNGKPHIAATQSRDEFTSSLVYFTRERGVWKKEVVDDQSAVLNDPPQGSPRPGCSRPMPPPGYSWTPMSGACSMTRS